MSEAMMRKAIAITRRRFIELKNQPALLGFILALPVVFMMLMGAVLGGGDGGSVPVALVMEAHGSDNAEIVAGFAAMFEDGSSSARVEAKIEGVEPGSFGRDEIVALMDQADVVAVILVPSNFGSFRYPETNQSTVSTYYDNAREPAMVNMAKGVVVGMIRGFAEEIQNRMLQHVPEEYRGASRMFAQPIVIEQTEVSSEGVDPFAMSVSGFLLMGLIWPTIIGASSLTVGDKNTGIRQRILATPTSSASVFLGDIVYYVALYLGQAAVLLAVAWGVYGVVIQGSLFLIAVLVATIIIGFVGIGLIVASFARTEQLANQIGLLICFPIMFFSGSAVPLYVMPEKVQRLLAYFPVTRANTALRQVIVEGAGMEAIGTEMAMMAVFSITILALGVLGVGREFRQ